MAQTNDTSRSTVKVPLLDLTAQYRAIEDEVRRAIDAVIGSQRFILGPVVEELEAAIAEYLDMPYAVGCASGTDALLLPLMALADRHGRGRGVVVPAFTFFGTAGAVWNAGLRPIFCDVDPDTFNVNADLIDAAWTDDTIAVIPVDLFGQMAPVEEIVELAHSRGATVIEDAAQAIGAARTVDGSTIMAGAAGDVGTLSFFPTKNLGGFGDGGMVTTADPDLADAVRKLRTHGSERTYYHEVVGTNSRLDALQAAVLLAKLPYLGEWCEARRANAARYGELLADVAGVRLPTVADGNRHVFNQYTIRVERRDELRKCLDERGISTGVYYPLPLHLQECFSGLGYSVGDLPACEWLCREVMSLSVYPELASEAVEYVAEAIRLFYVK